MEGGGLFTVMATPVEVPETVERSHWPVHVTVAGNFRVDKMHADDLKGGLVSIASHTARFSADLGPIAQFGVEHDIQVLLAEHPAFHFLHEKLAAKFERLPGFAPAEPSFWGEGYRPHATLGPAAKARVGDTLPIKWVTIAALRGTIGLRIATVELH